MKRLFTAVSLICLGICLEAKVVQLTPPTLNSETICEQIVCTRPMREGKFNISTESFGNKTLVNCYGMGGSGWTTLFGSVGKAIELFEQENKDKSIPIRIVGSGCMGLTSAIELSQRGYNIAGITTKSLYDMPSWRAAGYFALVSVKTSPEEQANLDKIGMDTFLTYQQIDQGMHSYIAKEAVRFIPVYCSENTDNGLENLEEMGLIPSHEEVTLDFGNGVTHPNYHAYMTYFLDTTSLMQQLTREVERLQIPIELKEIQSFDELQEEIIFNCTGMGARELNGDSKMIPVRGHLIALNEKSGIQHMDYMIYTTVTQDDREEYIYMFPKTISITPDHIQGVPCRSVLGGTFIPNVDQLSLKKQEELDIREFQQMLDRNSLFFTGELFQSTN
ncbi:MAG: FAD-dependent oxidoreductase [Chlamydiota bacterium]